MSVSIVKSNNTWLFTCKYLDPSTKQYKRACRRGFKTREEAIIAEAKFIEKMKSAPVKEITFGEMFYKYMEFRKNEIKETTYRNWIQRFEKHALPMLSDIPISKLNLRLFEEWRQAMIKKNLSDSYMNDILNPMKATLRYANDYYDMDISFIEKIKTFKSAHVFREEMKIWTYDQYRTFQWEMEDDILWNAFFNTLYFTGLRKGEAQALTWNDIDFERKTLTVNKTLAEKIPGVPYKILPPKTRSSYRTISLSNETADLLWKLKQSVNQKGSDFVFSNGKRHLSTTSIRRYFKYYQEKAKVPYIRIHDFRHSHASYLIGNGMNVVDVSKRLGHSDITMTLNTYTHFLPQQVDRIALFLNEQGDPSDSLLS